MNTINVRNSIQDALQAARFATASFTDMGGSALVRFNPEGTKARTEPQEETDYIRERTALYRDTWIIGPLEAALAEIDAEIARRKATKAR